MKGRIYLRKLSKKRKGKRKPSSFFHFPVDIRSNQLLNRLTLTSPVHSIFINEIQVRSDNDESIECLLKLKGKRVRIIRFVFSNPKSFGCYLTGRFTHNWRFAPGWSCCFVKQDK